MRKAKPTFQPTRPLRGATVQWEYFARADNISTHAPLAGRDMPPKRRNQHENISTHAPLAGRDQESKQAYGSNEQFQPTRPLRGATKRSLSEANSNLFQPTRPLRGATVYITTTSADWRISTHAPLAGRDLLALAAKSED